MLCPEVHLCTTGLGCSKQTLSLVNVSLKLQKVNISNKPICFIEKIGEAFAMLLSFF